MDEKTGEFIGFESFANLDESKDMDASRAADLACQPIPERRKG